MEQTVKMKEYINLVKQGEVARKLIPMGLNAGWPYLTIRNKQLCVTVPYFRSELKPNDGTLLYPITYAITTIWPNSDRVVAYKDLRYEKAFKLVDFTRPIGTFRHDALKNVTDKEYKSMCEELFAGYDEMIGCIYNNTAFEGQPRFSQLLKQLMEPAFKPIYMHLSQPFFGTYLEEGNQEK